MSDTLAPRAVIGVMTPAMNTVVQPELEGLRPAGVTNQMQRFRTGGDNVSDDIVDRGLELLDCAPAAIAVGLTSDAAPGGPVALACRCDELEQALGVPVCNASIADHDALRLLGAERIAVVTPFSPEVDLVVKQNFVAAGFDVVAITGTDAPTLPAICETPITEIAAAFGRVADASGIEAICQVGTALPVVAELAALEAASPVPIVACNAAVYRQTLRRIGIDDPIPGHGELLAR